MNKSKIVLRFLLPTYQNTPEAIHPTVCSLRHPTARFEADLMLDRLSFFTAGANVGSIGKFLDQSSYLARIISFVQTHPLWLLLCRLWASNRDTLKRRLDHFAVMSIRPGNRHANRYSVGFRQQTSFNTLFGTIRGIGAGFFPRQVGLLPWPHPSTAKTNQSLSTRHSLPKPWPRVSGKLRLGSIPEIANERCCLSKYPSHSKHSIGSRFATQRRCRPWPGGQVLSACLHQNDAYWDASVSKAQLFPIVRLKSCICSLFSFFSFLNPFRGTIASEIYRPFRGYSDRLLAFFRLCLFDCQYLSSTFSPLYVFESVP